MNSTTSSASSVGGWRGKGRRRVRRGGKQPARRLPHARRKWSKMWHVGDGMGWWMLWGGLMMLLFWGAIIALVVWFVQALGHREEAPGQPTAPRGPLLT